MNPNQFLTGGIFAAAPSSINVYSFASLIYDPAMRLP
jgi:hypothetical protein